MQADASGPLRVVTRGFWFPVGRSNFYDSVIDRDLILPYNAYEEERTATLKGYYWRDLPRPHPRLQTSVYSRLLAVLTSGFYPPREEALPTAIELLRSKRYSCAFPMFTATLYRLGSDSDPDAAAFVCTRNDLPLIPEWQDANTLMEGLALVTVADGFYVWLALYHGSSDRHEDRERQDKVEQALSKHIIALVGGNFFNRSANREGSP